MATKTTKKTAAKRTTKARATKAKRGKAAAAKTGAPKTGTKGAQLLAMLGKGATSAELSKALGWLPHTLRAAISRLDAKVQRSRSAEGVTSYRIET